ncbi:lysoplasmalogenase [Protaetiibacter mangrovi]|uniref:Lysoplasmalogenase n=1 Tax=Protaetiibacter mangrovi TaxID=2970926 RepID=A0ABT1ZBP4_9MICO|nr:lysoplasmalogenase [Protaetiibacter mangrovi]MCS0498108.1 lysoplasmalogenase [Protaetiibacter mangrovi]TPX03604.1 lysoplasmalogenase [Schumannella luteola]
MRRPRSRAALTAIAFAPFGVISLVHLGLKLADLVDADRATKGWTVPALMLGVVIVLWAGRLSLRTSVLAPLIAALTLSWLGDMTLPFFLVGLGFFLAAHVAYIVVFHVAFRRRPSWWAIGLVPWFAGLLLALWPYLGDLVLPVAVYGLVLAYMAASASRGNAFTTIGGALFVASDSLLAFRMFTPLFQTPPEDVLIMSLYLAAQLCITLGVLRTAVPRARRQPAAAAA